MKDAVQTIIGELLDHNLTLEQAVTAIDDAYRPKSLPGHRQEGRRDLHWVDVSKAGRIDVYHVTDCQGGDKCKLTPYLETDEGMANLKRARQYEAWYAKGAWQFEDVGESEDSRKKPAGKTK